MIKIFRNIRQKLLKENKTIGYLKYAIGEIILVVIGILIALQINNWNEKRKDTLKEKSVLAAIHEEFLQNRKQLDSVISYHKKSFHACEKLIKLFPIDIEKDNLDSISSYLNKVFYTWTFNPSQGSVNSIISTSSFDIIRNKELRDLLISWPDMVADFQENEIQARQTIYNEFDPFFSKNLDYNFNFKDKRNHLEALSSLEFEYLIRLRYDNLNDVVGKSGSFPIVTKSLDDIIRLSQNFKDL
ncbi:DUF6090 family protein [Gaetbulibacter aestuarii]|uniref:DUF6090 family protein n=1 Tax=Gaetbulibacter aestuarii TaxID=1502358 RepID=A0ABW7MVN7_9FLAO